MGIRSLANYRGMPMTDEDDESHVDVFWDSLNLGKDRVETLVEWRVQGHTVVLEDASRVPSGVIGEADIIPSQLLASLSTKRW